MHMLIPESEEAPLLVEQEELLRSQEEASDAFLAALLREAEEVKANVLWTAHPAL